MKRLLLLSLLALPLLSQAQVNFNFSVGDPGYYGQVYIDNGPQPEVMNTIPIIAYPGPPNYARPIYLRVPLYYYQNWTQYCQIYNACYTPVYFIQDYWYQQSYIPWYRNRYPYDVPKYRNRYPFDIPKYQNRYPNDVPKYSPAPHGNIIWHGETLPERYQRNNDRYDMRREGNR